MGLRTGLQTLLVGGLSLLGTLPQQDANVGVQREPVPSAESVTPPAVHTRPWKRSARRPRLSPLPVNRTRWLQGDVEIAVHRAGAGDLSIAGQLYRAFHRDATLQGMMSTRCGGLVRLPKRFHGSQRAVEALEGKGGEPGAFEKYFPQCELIKLTADGLSLGVGVARFVQADTDANPVLVRLDPEFLFYLPHQDRWFYRSLEGLLPITPGDGQWVLFTPYGRFEPWNSGLWPALARGFISKEHAWLHRENYSGKLANPARVAVSPQGAGDVQTQSWFRQVMAWGVNTVFGVKPGYDVKLLESNGRGYEVFNDTIKTSDTEFMIAIAGQVVTVTGGAGFANANIHATIRSDIIQGDGNALAECLNIQAIPAVVSDLCGDGERAYVGWDTRPPADMTAGAASISAGAKAIDDATAALKPHGMAPDVPAICARFAIPVMGDRNGDAVPDDKPAAPTPPTAPAPQPTSEAPTKDAPEPAMEAAA